MLHSGSGLHLSTEHVRTFKLREITIFKVYRIIMAANKQTHTSLQCRPTSVGLTQARPNHSANATGN